MSTASPSDVKAVIDTTLSDSEIQNFLDDAEFEAKDAIQNYDTDLTTTEKTQLEKYLAALLIRTTKEKDTTSESAGNRSLNYENVMSVEELRAAVSKRDPSDSLAVRIVKDGNRYINSLSS